MKEKTKNLIGDTELCDLLGDTELCDLLGVHRSTLYKWRKKNWIPFYQIGRNIKYDLDEVLEFAKSLN